MTDQPAVDQSEWPAHLRDDAPHQRCNRCGRKTWDTEPFNWRCLMRQPDGVACDGTFGPEVFHGD